MTSAVPVAVRAVTPHGVTAGDWIRYDVSASGSSPEIDPALFTMDWFAFEYLEVIDSEVTTLFTIRYLNGTEDSMTYSWDVLSGDELWLIPAGLQAGDVIPWDTTVINATVLRPYVGATRLVTVVEFLYSEGSYSEQMWIYWDQATGLLMELTLEIREGLTTSRFQYLAIDTNRWTASLALSLQLSAATVQQGDVVTLSARVTDVDGGPVDAVSVHATLGTTSMLLTGLGEGQYQATLATSGLTGGSHTVTVQVQKSGYTSAQSSTLLTVTLPIIDLILTPHLATSTVSQDSAVILSARVSDPMNASIPGASVTATLGNVSIILADLGNGQYQGTLDTSPMVAGIHTVTVQAQKSGYTSAQSSVTLTLLATPLTVTPQLSAERVSQGSTVTIIAMVTDARNASITGATVIATCGSISIALTDHGNGQYQGILATTTLSEGSHSIHISAQTLDHPLAQTVTSLTVTSPGMPWIYYLGFAGIITSISAGVLYRWKRRSASPQRPSPPSVPSGDRGVMTQTLVTTTSRYHIGRIIGLGTGIMMLISVFLLPYTSTTDASSLFTLVQPLLSNLGAISTFPAETIAMTYVLIIGFLLVAIGGVVGFFPLGSGVLGIVGMALLTVAPTLIVNTPTQYRAFGLGYYFTWAGAIGGLIAAFLRSRRKTTVQTTHVSSHPTSTGTLPPTTRARKLSVTRKTILVSTTLLVIILAADFLYFDMIPWPSTPLKVPDGATDGDGGDEFPVQGDVLISTDDPTPVLSQSVDSNGGVIEVTDPALPVHGLRIQVPTAATAEPISFTVSYSSIRELRGVPENMSVASKLITIEATGSERWNEDRTFDQPVLLTLPYDPSVVAEGYPVRFYYYDTEHGLLESAGFFYESPADHTISFFTSTFSGSDYLTIVGIVYQVYWKKIFETSFDTGFRPKVDGWFIPNTGSYLNPMGNCAGMAAYAKWYYGAKAGLGVGLYEKYRAGQTPAERAEWRDDATAIQLATRLQSALEPLFRNAMKEYKYTIPVMWKPFDCEWDALKVATTWLHAMILTGQPQLIALYATLPVDAADPAKGRDGQILAGHMVMTYKYTIDGVGPGFEVYDPNNPGSEPGTRERRIFFNTQTGFPVFYTSSQRQGAALMRYNTFMAFSYKMFAPPHVWTGLAAAAEFDFKDNSIFPTVTLTDADTTPQGKTPVDTDGDRVRDTNKTTATISGTVSGGRAEVPGVCIFVNGEGVYSAVTHGHFSQIRPLRQGDNHIIILATERDTKSAWAGYLSDTIRCTASKTTFSVTLIFPRSDTDLDLHVKEPTINNRDGRHIYWMNRGGETSAFPYLDIDDTNGYGPEHYFASENMTLPNDPANTTSLYGTYQIRVHYYTDRDENAEDTQAVPWHLTIKYLAYRHEATNTEYWIEDVKTGMLYTANAGSASEFDSTDPSWTDVWVFEYPPPDPTRYELPPPPQNIITPIP
jgi:uncharacterized protein YfaP (DUF2135 family)